ncbi:MAG: propionyl-CoA carboxylase beta chain [Chloroflexi bacterium]|jgi:propionyl-CoA carboxylase beta chain|nr:MAG: propionyl-CoA carboxylase beta chain [Chloroflexota bacterium]
MSQENSTSKKNEELSEKKALSLKGGGDKRVEAQHKRGKLTARERISLLLDDGSFEELDPLVLHRSTNFGLGDQHFLGDAVVTGYGEVNGRLTFVYAQDFTVLGGSLSEAVANKICKVMDKAIESGAPIIGLIDSGGARIQEGIDSLSGYGSIFHRNVMSSGVIPQISVMMGPAAGGATYSPALTDFIFMVEGLGQMYITGPDVIRAVTSEDISHEDLGGTEAHTVKSGVAHFAEETEESCIARVKELLSYLPQNNMENSPLIGNGDSPDRYSDNLNGLIPDNPNQPYNMLDIIHTVVDEDRFLQVHKNFAPNILVGFASFDGKSVGIVAQQPDHFAGVLDIDASVKAARFVRFCDAFNIPLVTFIDVPGFMPGSSQEYGGIIRHGAKLIFAYAEATVPKISVLIRKAYGGAYIVMSSKNLKGDINYSWPTGQVAVMGAEGAVNIIHRSQIRESDDPQKLTDQLVTEYEENLMNPYIAASRGMIDDVIEPGQTRLKVIRALKMLANKRETIPPKKHGSIPL